MEPTMRVIYKPYMMRRIEKVWIAAKQQDREIEKIKLNLEEWEQLKYESAQNMGPEEWYRRFQDNNRTVPTFVECYGIRIEKE
jgi:hypothetical protein